tara:strand:- start:1758 stop:2324 length:567 start_codon:yes stop_codon:yes gene_type:complete
MLIRLLKILIATASCAYSIHLFTGGYTGAGIGMVILTILLVLMSLRSMRLVMAFVYLRQQKMDDAKKWLGRVRVNQLWPKQRGYYYFLMGSLTMEQNMNDAEKLLKQAISLGLKHKHDEAAAKLNLAVVASARRNLPEAKKLINECKRLDEKNMMTRDIKMVEDALKGGGARQMQGRGARRKASRGKR